MTPSICPLQTGNHRQVVITSYVLNGKPHFDKKFRRVEFLGQESCIWHAAGMLVALAL